MSKGNLLLGQARGRVGDVVFTRIDGEQVARSRNRAPKNPQTPIQLLQRSIMKTNSLGYSMFRDIADHAFQGKAQGTECQSEFSRLNIAAMRDELAQLINDNDPEEILSSQEFNYSSKGDSLPVLREYILSSGTLTPISTKVTATGFEWLKYEFADAAAVGTMTYNDLVQALGVQKGDQLTFCLAYVDDSIETPFLSKFVYSRIILEPADGDMTKNVFAVSAGAATIDSANANPRNEGSQIFNQTGNGLAIIGEFSDQEWTAGSSMCLVACAVIVSRQTGGVWQRSRAQFSVRSNSGTAATTNDHMTAYLGDAIHSYMTQANSSLYLNQAQDF